MNINAKGIQLVCTTMLVLAILQHALNDLHFKAYRNRCMLEGTLTALLAEFYNIPESIQFSESILGRQCHAGTSISWSDMDLKP